MCGLHLITIFLLLVFAVSVYISAMCLCLIAMFYYLSAIPLYVTYQYFTNFDATFWQLGYIY